MACVRLCVPAYAVANATVVYRNVSFICMPITTPAEPSGERTQLVLFVDESFCILVQQQ